MVLLARWVPLGPGRPRFVVRFHPSAGELLVDEPRFEALVDEVAHVLAMEPFRPSGRRSKRLTGTPLYRYRPHAAADWRVLYSVEGPEVHVLAIFPRKKDYPRSVLETALRRRRDFTNDD